MSESLGSLNIGSPTGLEVVRADNLGALLANVVTGQLRDACGYQVATVASGTLTIGSSTAIQSQLIVRGTAEITTLTINLTVAPLDGQKNLIFANQEIGTLTLSVAAGQTLDDAVTTVASLGAVGYVYAAATSTWYRCL